MQQYRTGDSVIFKVLEREIHISVADLYPDSLQSADSDEANQPVSLSIHSWVVRTPTILL